METARVFANGGSQAVRLPKNCRFDDDEIMVNRIGNIVILMPKDDPWAPMMKSLDYFTEDFMIESFDDFPVQERDGL